VGRRDTKSTAADNEARKVMDVTTISLGQPSEHQL